MILPPPESIPGIYKSLGVMPISGKFTATIGDTPCMCLTTLLYAHLGRHEPQGVVADSVSGIEVSKALRLSFNYLYSLVNAWDKGASREKVSPPTAPEKKRAHLYGTAAARACLDAGLVIVDAMP